MLEHLIDGVQRDSVVAASGGRQVERQQDLPVLSSKADAVVRDHKLQRPVFGAADGDPDSPRSLLWLDAVSDRVFHQHLKRELRNKAGKQRLVRDGHLIGYFIAEAHLLQFYIKFRVLQLLRQRDLDVASAGKPRLRQPRKVARHFLDVRISIHLRHERDAAQDVIHEMRVDLTLQESKLAVHGDELFLINVVDQMVDRVRHGVERLTHGGKFLTIVLRELDAEILLRDLPELERHLLKRPQPPHHSEEHDRCDGKQKQNAGDHIRRGDLI